jgi:hypothetical protein
MEPAVPAKLALARIEDMIARDEEQLARYLHTAEEAEAEGLDPGHRRGSQAGGRGESG